MPSKKDKDLKPLSFYAKEILGSPVWKELVGKAFEVKMEALEAEELQLTYGTPEHQHAHLVRRGFKDGVMWLNRKLENTAKGNKK